MSVPMKKTMSGGRRTAIIVIALLLLFGSRWVPAPAGLSQDAMQVLGIFLGSIFMWMTLAIDWPSFLTLLALGLMPVFGFKSVFQNSFGADTFPFLVFTFMLTYPLSKTNFVRRCTIAFITNRFARRGPWWFITFLFAAVTCLGCFISPSVLFVAFLPFLEDIFRVLRLEKGSKTAQTMMLGVAFCTSISSGMTPVGHVWPTMAIGFYQTATGLDINQFQYMAMGIPTGILCVALMIVVFRFLLRPGGIRSIDPGKAMELKGSLPKADRKEKIILFAMAVTVFLWVAPSLLQNVWPAFYTTVKGWTTAMPPLVGCIILSIATVDGKQVMDFKEATSKGVLWASPIMCAATLALGACLTNGDIGITAWLSDRVAPLTASIPMLALVAFFVVWALVQTNLSSNIVTTTVVCSIAIPLMLALPEGSICVPAVASIIGMAAGFAFMTPPAMTAVNGVAAASGWTDARSMFLWGGINMVLDMLVMIFVSYPLANLFM